MPGCETVRLIYDRADRLVLEQNGTQRAGNRWTVHKYDAIGRLLYSFEHMDATDIATLRNRLSGIWATESDSGNAPLGIGYTNTTVGWGSDVRLLEVNYYDDYSFLDKLTSAERNALTNALGGTDIEYVAYNFAGDPVKRRRVHTATGKPGQTEVYSYTYDHAGRLLTTQFQPGSEPEVTLVSCTYDDLGRLKTRTPHGIASAKLTYDYNLRGWLTAISGNKFSQSLYYTDGPGTPCYNGNISSMTWKAGNETTLRGYKFTYDGLNRMLDAVYGEGTSISSNANRFTEKVTGYDKNGNILALQRYGQTGVSSYGLIDNLTFTLDGNQLNRVDDAVTASAYNNGFEFKDAVKQANLRVQGRREAGERICLRRQRQFN